LEELWTPKITPENGVEDIQSEVFWLRNDGRVWSWRKSLLRLKCNMNFTYMPHDLHTCAVRLTSFFHDFAAITFYTGALNAGFPRGDGVAVRVDPCDLKYGQVDFQVIDVGDCTDPTLEGSAYNSVIFLEFKLGRKSGYWEHYALAPVVLLALISWLSFFIARSAVPARVAITIIAFLALSGLVASVLATLPRIPVNDVWLLRLMTTTYYFIFFSVMEYAICNYLFRVEERVKKATAEVNQMFDALAKKQGSPAGTIASPRSPGTGRGEAIRRPSRMIEKPKSMTSDDPLEEVEPIEDTSLRVKEIRKRVARIDRLILNSKGKMRFKDQHIDICARYGYLLAYVCVLIVFYSQLPDYPQPREDLAVCSNSQCHLH